VSDKDKPFSLNLGDRVLMSFQMTKTIVDLLGWSGALLLLRFTLRAGEIPPPPTEVTVSENLR
jgi:hypothetical protein